ncbi:ABC transporter permease [Kordiimonas sp. SCSIO 12610]|uniref:ABC transporter permease n=1 Tax=Kordiimonas sp. SCSIO 12610 TaxID=2829597 RepID=UPI00210E9C15|nr:FtsX-like permease family protein [Kordiimonas sp. SCSIO 12610]UTW55195.1 FtsX-like permease family protein [Kordiimonas sp. SCSIO 12610]
MLSRSINLPIAIRFALRELRGGLSGFRIFIACLTLGVAAIATVASLTKAIEEGLEREGQTILGGDMEVNSFQSDPGPELLKWAQDQGEVSVSARLRTMARIEGDESLTATGDTSTLVELRAVDEAYPLYGTLDTSPQLDNKALFDKRGETWGAAVDPLLAERLNIGLGDTLTFGNIQADIRAFIDREPDKANQGFQLGPSVLIRREAMDKTGLITLGSLVNYYYKIRVAPETDLEAMREEIKETWPDERWRVRDRSNSAAGLRRFIDRMGEFLVIVGLAALIVGGVGVGNAVKGYMDRKTRTIATMKILGADGQTIFTTYFMQVIFIGILSIILGLAIGAFMPSILASVLPDTLPIKPEGGIYPAALSLASAYGLMITVAFTAWPLGKARDLPAVRLFRALVAPETGRPRLSYLLLISLAVASVIAMAVGLANNPAFAFGFLLSAMAALAILLFTSWLLQRLAARLPRSKNALVRMAIANLHRPGSATSAVVISLGLGLTLFATITLIEGNLQSQLGTEVPEEAPAFFILDIQSNQVDAFEETAKSIKGVEDVETIPSLRGRVTKVKGIDASEYEVPDSEYRWVLRGDRGFTYQSDLPESNEIVDGDWWPADYAGGPEISLGKEAADGLGLSVGDTMTISILGREITATIRSTRQINWGTFGFNFVILFDPYTLKAAPHTYTATLKADGETEKLAYRTLTREFRNITAIRMKEVLSSVNTIVSQVSIAVEATGLVAIFSGVFVLAGAIAAGFRQRVYESVILKVVGAVRSQILRAYLLEYTLIGLITALIALGLGTLAGWLVITQLWESEFRALPGPMLTIVAVSLAVTIIFGLGASFRALSIKPNEVLRSE